MNRDRWLAALIRARQAREDVARASAARAERAEGTSRRAAAALHTAAGSSVHTPAELAQAFAAAAAARATTASLFSAALDSWKADAARSVDARALLAQQAGQRRTAEKLAQRRQDAHRARQARTEQATLDEIAARRRQEDR